MDEILIEDKKYVSSKRAAKITGYAKDYVGQLCREGRVPARLVGRGWYVLESAIQDHRFGNPEIEQVIEVKSVKPTAPIPSTWESPRYEAASEELLPSINRLNGHEDVTPEADDGSQSIQDSWKAWFDRFDTATEKPIEEEVTEEPIETPEEVEEEEIFIPIHVYTPPPEELLPRAPRQAIEEMEEEEPVTVNRGRRRDGRRVLATLRIAGVVFALLFASLAVIGSGYLDSYIVSNKQASFLAGVALYNK